MAPLTPAAVLFDLDGTLVDSLGDIAASMNHVLLELGHPVHDRASIRSFVGEGARHLVARSLPSGSSEAAIDHALALYKARYRSHLIVETKPYDGIEALLSTLAQRGVRLGVVTNKPEAAAIAMVKTLFGEGRFGVVIGEDPTKPRKPHPGPALEAARALEVAPSACCFVGDTSVDIETGRAAGMTTIGVTWGFRDADDLEGADHVVSSVRALTERFG